jgi:DnaJ-class molecular chaperone
VKTFGDQNYYEILKISKEADIQDIKRAYRDALDLYEADSLATYALFSDEQRAELLDAIEAAYYTLSDPERRNDYDRRLLGPLRQSMDSPEPDTENIPEPPMAKTVGASSKDLNAWVRRRAREDDIKRQAEEIIRKDLISGSDLKKFRLALEIELQEIYAVTRISVSSLTLIEENQFQDLPAEVFLKSFLKSYAEILQIDSHRVVEGYLRYMSLAGKPDL